MPFKLLLLITMFAVASTACAAGGMWVKGNTHTHTNQSDGDSPPEVVVEWYKSHGYNFLVLSDHNVMVDPSKYDTDPADNFVLISGEEISASFGKLPVHVNGLGINGTVKPETGENLVNTIQRNVDLVVNAGGLPHVNHPNFHYAFNHRELEQVERCNLLEIYNGHPAVNNAGNMAHMSVEQVWDVLLSKGKTIYGIAVDDAHHFSKFEPGRANPGRGWIVVRVEKLSASEILDNIRKGNFYASTGVELGDYYVKDNTIKLAVKPAGGVTYTICFIGLYGQILREVDGVEATYRLTGKPSEAYVRAKVIGSDGLVAWTQPVRRK